MMLNCCEGLQPQNFHTFFSHFGPTQRQALRNKCPVMKVVIPSCCCSCSRTDGTTKFLSCWGTEAQTLVGKCRKCVSELTICDFHCMQFFHLAFCSYSCPTHFFSLKEGFSVINCGIPCFTPCNVCVGSAWRVTDSSLFFTWLFSAFIFFASLCFSPLLLWFPSVTASLSFSFSLFMYSLVFTPSYSFYLLLESIHSARFSVAKWLRCNTK